MFGVSNYAIATILCLQTLFGCLCSTINQYVYFFYLHTYPNSSNSTSNYTTTTSTHRSFYDLLAVNNETDTCSNNQISPDREAQAWAQQRSAELFFRLHLMSSCPVIIMTYILGLYTSQLGKRLVLVLPMLGMSSQVAIWLSIIYFHLSEFWWYIGSFLNGLSGSSGVLGLALNLIITENTMENERSSRFVHFGAMQTALAAGATFGIGYYITWRGFTDLYWMALSSQILSITIVIFFFKSADIDLHEQTPLLSSTTTTEFSDLSSTTCSHFLKVCTVFRSDSRPKKKTASLFLTLFSNIFYILATTAFAPFLWFLLNAPFCWTSKDIGNYSAVGAISSAILSLVGMHILTYVGASDAIICVISQVFFCASALWIGFARHTWQLYVGLLISAFSGYQGSLTTSMVSKWLKPHERSSAFTLITEINTIVCVFGNSFFNWIYASTVVNFRNLTLFIAAGLSGIPFILNICLFMISRKISDDEEIPTLSETDVEAAPLSLESHLPPHAGDAACLIIRPRSRSVTSLLRTPSIGRSRTNTINDNETEDLIIPPTVNVNI